MAAGQVTLDAEGRLVVPPRPVIPVVAGDGVGPELWAAARPVLDGAVSEAYAGDRSIEWRACPGGDSAVASGLPRLPATTVAAFRTHLVGLCGPLGAESGELHPIAELSRALGLAVLQVRVRSLAGVPSGAPGRIDATVFAEASEGAAAAAELGAGTPAAAGLLDAMRRELPREFSRVRFGSRERTDSYLRATGRRETPLVEVALGVQPTTRFGTRRAVLAAVEHALASARPNVLLVHPSATWPVSSEAFVEWAWRVLAEELPERVMTARDLARSRAQGDGSWAEGERDALVKGGGTFVDELLLEDALARAVREPQSFDVVVAPWSAAEPLAYALAAQAGGAALAPAALLERAHGRAVFGPLHGPAPRLAGTDLANPVGLALAGEQLLRHLGWTEAADLALRGIERTLASGRLTADLATRSPGSSPVGCAAFAEAALAAIAQARAPDAAGAVGAMKGAPRSR